MHFFKVEHDDLEEFEFLERYAEDNSSFLSNVSAVNRILSQNKVGHRVKASQKPSSEPIKVDPSHGRTSIHAAANRDGSIGEENEEDGSDGELENETLRNSDIDCDNDDVGAGPDHRRLVSMVTGEEHVRSAASASDINEKGLDNAALGLRRTAHGKDVEGSDLSMDRNFNKNRGDAAPVNRKSNEQLESRDWQLRDVSDMESEVTSSSEDEDSSFADEEVDGNNGTSRYIPNGTEWKHPSNDGNTPRGGKKSFRRVKEEGNEQDEEENDGWNFKDDEVWDESSFQRKRHDGASTGFGGGASEKGHGENGAISRSKR